MISHNDITLTLSFLLRMQALSLELFKQTKHVVQGMVQTTEPHQEHTQVTWSCSRGLFLPHLPFP